MRKVITDSATASFFLAQPSLHLNEKTQPADDKGHPRAWPDHPGN